MPPTKSALFIDSEDNPLKIFICSGIRQHFRLTRLIRSHGGQIVLSHADAQILITDKDDSAGRGFVESWGNEPGKVVLDQQWVFVSERCGEWPDEENNWGGYCLNKTGISKPTTSAASISNSNEEPSFPKRARKRPLKTSSQSVPHSLPTTPPTTVTREDSTSLSEPPSQDCGGFPSSQICVSPSKLMEKAVFVREDGKSMLFYVQVNLKNRMAILSWIRRGGGQIIANLADSDIVILDPNSKQFGLIAQEDRPMYPPSWPELCMKAGYIIDDDEVKLSQPIAPSRSRKRAKRDR